jgi:hypothetical protein
VKSSRNGGTGAIEKLGMAQLEFHVTIDDVEIHGLYRDRFSRVTSRRAVPGGLTLSTPMADYIPRAVPISLLETENGQHFETGCVLDWRFWSFGVLSESSMFHNEPGNRRRANGSRLPLRGGFSRLAAQLSPRRLYSKRVSTTRVKTTYFQSRS